MSVAVCCTVLDEDRLLPDNLRWHRFLGAERAYVYLSRGDTRTAPAIAGLGFVETAPSGVAPGAGGGPVLAWLQTRSRDALQARQSLDALDAMRRARGAGLRWLLHLDADELACADLGPARPGALAERLDALPPAVAVARFPALEVLQRRARVDRPLREQVVFKTLCFEVTKHVPDPRGGARATVRGFYGHRVGKCAVRLDADAVPFGSHLFVAPDGGPLPGAVAGRLLHYHCFDAADFVRRQRLRADARAHYLLDEAVEPHRRLWRALAGPAGLTDEALERYYREHLLYRDAELDGLRCSHGRTATGHALVRTSAVAALLGGIRGAAPPDSRGRIS